MTYREKVKRAAALMAERGVRCDCGWDTGDHAPECAVEAAWDRAMGQVEEGE